MDAATDRPNAIRPADIDPSVTYPLPALLRGAFARVPCRATVRQEIDAGRLVVDPALRGPGNCYLVLGRDFLVWRGLAAPALARPVSAAARAKENGANIARIERRARELARR